MKLLIAISLLILIAGIAIAVQANNSTGKGIIPGEPAQNIANQTNNSINQTNISSRMILLNQTNISPISMSSFGENDVVRSDVVLPTEATYNSVVAKFPSKMATQMGVSSAMMTPSQTAFESE